MQILKNGTLINAGLYAQAVGLPVGFIYEIYSTELSGLQLRLDGTVKSRTLYPALWKFVTEHPSVLKSEEEWQQIAAGDDGHCMFYSSGDGSGTFRLPKFPSNTLLGDLTTFVVQAYGFSSTDKGFDITPESVAEEAARLVGDSYVAKAGDTMTGPLTVPKIITTTGIEIY